MRSDPSIKARAATGGRPIKLSNEFEPNAIAPVGMNPDRGDSVFGIVAVLLFNTRLKFYNE
mgnify:FL=1